MSKTQMTSAMRALLLGASAVALAGCNPTIMFDTISTGSIFAAPKQAAFQHTLSEQRPVQEAMAELPFEAGKLVEVVQSRYANGLEQTLVFQGDLATRGTNSVTIAMQVPQGSDRKDASKIKFAKPSRSVIAAEMRNALPGLAMRWSNTLHSNAYGPYGYALGRASGNVRCIYGWQHLEGNKQDKFVFWRRESGKPQLSVRLRICRANVSSERLVDLMQNLRINANPDQVRMEANTTWSAGNGAAGLGVASTGNGYVSNQRVAVEPVAEPKPVVARRVVKRKAVAKRVARVRKPIAQPITTATYSAPVPTPEQLANGTLTQTNVVANTQAPAVSAKLPLPPIVAGGAGGGVASGAKTLVPVAAQQVIPAAPQQVTSASALYTSPIAGSAAKKTVRVVGSPSVLAQGVVPLPTQ